MITGHITLNADKTTFTATISTLMFDIANLHIAPNGYKAADNHPDFQIIARTPRGREMRVGSMWKAVSETSKREYFSLIVTDRAGRMWRMNAVRNDTTPKNTWEIVPMVATKTESIAVSGNLELLDDGNIAGSLGGYDFDMDFVAIENVHKQDDKHPDWHIEAKSPAGVPIRMGSIWNSKSQRTGTEYLSMAFMTPVGTNHRANALMREAEGNAYEIVPMAQGEMSAA